MRRVLTETDWGRIYAFLALELRKNPPDSPEYQEYEEMKQLLEKDPVQGVKAIIAALNKDYPDNQIPYEPYSDVLCPDVARPEDSKGAVSDDILKSIRGGETSAFLVPRLAC